MVRKKIKKVTSKAKSQALKFKQELKKAIVTAITTAFSFLIALVWRDAITEYINKITEVSPVRGTFISAIIVTIICVIGILIISYFVSEKKN